MSKKYREIKVVYHTGITHLIYDQYGRIDVRSAEKVVLGDDEIFPVFRMVPLGFSAELPPNHEAELTPRASLYKNHFCIMPNSPGIIDTSFCGTDDQWYMPLVFFRPTQIDFNEKIAQFRIVKVQPVLYFKEVAELESIPRGGFGSTGKF